MNSMRGYGIRLWFFFQSMGQLAKCFGAKASVFLDNIDTGSSFGRKNADEDRPASNTTSRCPGGNGHIG